MQRNFQSAAEKKRRENTKLLDGFFAYIMMATNGVLDPEEAEYTQEQVETYYADLDSRIQGTEILTGIKPVTEFTSTDGSENVRSAMNQGILHLVEESKRIGFRYCMGAKGEGGLIDCSGFSALAVKAALQATGESIQFTNDTGQAVQVDLNSDIAKQMRTHASGQMVALKDATGGEVIVNPDISQLKPGMVLTTTGQRHAASRAYGIGHVLVTYEDRNGTLRVAHSSSVAGGVTTEPASRWLNRQGNRTIYANDLVAASVKEERVLEPSFAQGQYNQAVNNIDKSNSEELAQEDTRVYSPKPEITA